MWVRVPRVALNNYFIRRLPMKFKKYLPYAFVAVVTALFVLSFVIPEWREMPTPLWTVVLSRNGY